MKIFSLLTRDRPKDEMQAMTSTDIPLRADLLNDNVAAVRGRLSRSAIISLICVLALTALLRCANFPHRYETRDVDDTNYMGCGLLLSEGMTPGMRVAPAAPETWFTWLYVMTRSSDAIVRPHGAMAMVSWQARPFLAIDSVLFDIYQDMSGLHRFLLFIQFGISLCGAYAAFRFGAYYGGVRGGILIGGLVALLPLYIDFASMSRPYSDAWNFTFISLYSAAALRGTRRWIQTGLFLMLGMSSRIDMLGAIPVVLWQFWENPDRDTAWWKPALKTVLTAFIGTLVLSPWLLLSPVGILRTMALARAVGWTSRVHPRLETLRELGWEHGLAPVLILTAFALPLAGASSRMRRWVLAAYVIFLVMTMFNGPYQPMRYHGAPLIGMLTLAGLSIGDVFRRWPKAVPAMMAIMLVLPAVQAIRYIRLRYAQWTPQEATAWIEQHVPAGTRVYDAVSLDLRCPLPTAESADAIWTSVTDAQAWRKKFERGLTRFGLSGSVPRAFSEDNLVLDRGLFRRFFILGGGAQSLRPRYDLRILGLSQIFGTQNLPEEFVHTGGVVIWRESYLPPAELGKPTIQWTDRFGEGTFIYCSPDVLAKLKN